MLRGKNSSGRLKPLLPQIKSRCFSTTLRARQDEVDPLAQYGNGVPPPPTPNFIDRAQRRPPRQSLSAYRERKAVRTLFYVPGSSLKMLDKAWKLEPDNIVYINKFPV